MRGKFIAFEGGEGCGKSTQASKLVDALRSTGLTALNTREPGGTPGAEAIRSLLLDPPGKGWGVEAEALLFAAARADHVAKHILPALDRGDWVVSDRFLDSSRAYQGGAGMMGDETIRTLHAIGSRNLLPDLTIVLDVDDTTTARRLGLRDAGKSDAIGGRNADYHTAVNQAFRQFADAESGRFAVVPGTGSIDEVHDRVWQAVQPLLDQRAA